MSSTELIRVGRTTWEDLWPAAGPLFSQHREEIRLVEPRLRYEVDLEACASAVRSGAALAYAAHAGSVLVGYLFWYLAYSLEAKGTLVAQQGPWFVAPAFRQSSAGLRLWQTSKEELRGLGVRQLAAHRAPGSDSRLDAFFAKQGGRLVEIVWSIILD